MAKAGFLYKINSDIKIDDFSIKDPDDNEVTVKQSYSGVCFRDILTRNGFQPRVNLPVIPGHEIEGTIIKTGKNVKNFKINDRVSSLIYVPCGKCEYCLSGNENLCPYKKNFGETINGGYSQYVNVNENSLVNVPDNVSHEAAAIAACVTGMLYHALHTVGKIKKDDYVLITGAGGGVGVHAVQMVKALGGHPIAETSSKWKEEELYKLGAEHIVDSSSDYNREIKKISNGVNIALETVGISTFSKSLRSLKPGGRMVVIGNLKPEPVDLPLGLIILKGNSIKGSISSTKTDLREALRLNSENKIKPVIGEKIDLNDINNAYNDMLNRKVFGRVLIKY